MDSFIRKLRNEKESKSVLIYNLLLERKNLSRSDIANLTSINIVSISNYINDFIKRGLVVEKELGASSGGRPPVILEISKNNLYAIGLEISADYIIGVLIDGSMGAAKKDKRKIKKEVPIKFYIAEILKILLESIDKNNIKGLGLVSDKTMDLENYEGVVKEILLSNGVATPKLYHGRSSLSAAYGEAIEDIAYYKEHKMLYCYGDLGDCILFENQHLYTCEDDSDSNLLYLKNWPRDMGITNYAKKIIEKGVGTEMISLLEGSLDNITDDIILDAADKSDSLALEILESRGLNLGVRLAYLVNVFSPQRLILGGGIEKLGKYFVEPLKKSVEKLASQMAFSSLEIKNSALGDEAAATGAAALIIREIFMGV